MRNKSIKRKEDLKEILKKCSCCDEIKLASVTSKYSEFGTYYNGYGWYYYSYCKSCYREKSKYYSSYYSTTARKEYIKERIRLKNKEHRRNREWTVYRLVIDTTNFSDKVKKKYKLKQNYYYVGVTKQKIDNRFYKHLYDLRNVKHSNYFLQCIYSKIRKQYLEMSDNEYFNFFKNDIIRFEVIAKLDKNYSNTQALIYEQFEIKKLENQLKINKVDDCKQIIRYNKNYKESDLINILDEMIVNVDKCKSNKKFMKEIKARKKDTSSDQTESIS